MAALSGLEPAIQLLLRMAPNLATAAAPGDWRPLHSAASAGHAGAVRMLLQAAPATALAKDAEGRTPAFMAALKGQPAALQLLLEAEPAAATIPNNDGLLPLAAALASGASGAAAAARCLLPYGSTAIMLLCFRLADDGQAAAAVLPECIAARLPLTREEWALVPRPCSGLGAVLPAALRCSPAQARCLVQRLPTEDQQRLRVGALALARAQRKARPSMASRLSLRRRGEPLYLPRHIIEHILALSAT